jgi:protein-L-isoaspartate O-methyltransferase
MTAPWLPWLWSLPSKATTGCSTSRRSGPEVTPGMYAVDLSSLAGSQLAATFVPSQRDGTTDRFLATAARDGCDASKLAAAKRDRTRFVHAQRLRGWSRTDASAAFLNMSLLVASPAQLRRVLAPALAAASGSRSQGRTTAAAAVAAAAPSAALTLLDIGAGRGEATAALASALGVRAQDVTVMEAAAQIRRRLTAERGYRAVSSFAELGAGQTFLQLATCYLLLATYYLLLTTRRRPDVRRRGHAQRARSVRRP